jgi:DNA-binding NtrC family response regulator
MALLLIVGTDAALIEGMSQTLTGAGHEVMFARGLAEAIEAVGDLRPLVLLVERSAIDEIRSTLRVPQAEGGAILVFHPEDTVSPSLPHRLQRATLAELELPLERQRLLALIRYVEKRAHTVGRDVVENGAEAEAGNG